MAYSVKQYINTPNKEGRAKVYVQVILNRNKIKIPSDAYAENGKLSPLSKKIYDQKEKEINNLIEDAIYNGEQITRELLLRGKKKNELLLTEYIDDLIENVLPGVLSKSRIAHYHIVRDKVKSFNRDWLLKDCNPDNMNRFVSYLADKEKLDPATVLAKVSNLLAVINRAITAKIIPPDSMFGFKKPKKVTKYITYLKESEVDAFEVAVKNLAQNRKKICGYYFLLSCYAGYRISDLYTFDYHTMVDDGYIKLRAQKNGRFVTMPIHERLDEVLNYIKDNPIGRIPQADMREYVKSIAYDAGIQKHVKVHTGRHTFGAFLATNGLSVKQLSDYLGDGKEAATLYAHLVPNANDEKVMNIFKRKEKIKA